MNETTRQNLAEFELESCWNYSIFFFWIIRWEKKNLCDELSKFHSNTITDNDQLVTEQ